MVFDGSAPASSGLSLNDILLRGPKVQPDIISIILRFRLHAVAITADVAKMYRQVLLHEDDRNLHRICYRESPDQPLQDYKLCTVTYGTKSASFLATRCLMELSRQVNNPVLQRIISEDFYVDDLLSGGQNDDQCYELHQSVSKILEKAGFPLRKWCSNSSTLMSRISTTSTEPTYRLSLTDEDTVSTLGLSWQPSSDTFHFSLANWNPPGNMTKRSLLSDINRIYDPLGLLSPVLIKGKVFLQQLWSLKLNWDSTLSPDLQGRWIKFYSSLKTLEELSIPRRVVSDLSSNVSLHGFCDASQEAYGACIYLCSRLTNAKIQVRLLMSKSRVAPMHTTTIPRLELCGALLLSELMVEARTELARIGITVQSTDIHLWTDSTVVIGWIQAEVQLKVFVANRVTQIRDMTEIKMWRYVPTSDNPADLISRGVPVESILLSDSIWWCGPSWLQQDSTYWPNRFILTDELPELRPLKLALAATEVDSQWLLEKCSKWTSLLRITAYIQRFIHNCKPKTRQSSSFRFGPLKTSELQSSKIFWLRKAQGLSFQSEINDLTKKGKVSHRSCLNSLNPFINQLGLICVGGRLANAPVPESQRFPVVLPTKNKITKMIFEHEHIRLLHIGPQGLLANMQLIYWPMRGRNIARQVVHRCTRCFRANPKFLQPFMAPLPTIRVTPCRPFIKSGVDFCGPVNIRSGLRRVASLKHYIAVFVCMVTRAIHLELVRDLSSDAFIAALFRFISRRGQCTHLYSDNGTNFTGSDKILKSWKADLYKENKFQDQLTNLGIEWTFIPPSAPHFGGLWEAGVKSAKKHLIRVSNGALLTYEEMSTLLCRIEAVLNSRPITVSSPDPSDYSALTPGHFLIGSPLTLPPEPDVSTLPDNRLRQFKLIQSRLQHFWKRWSTEYMPQLQRRGRWTEMSKNLSIGDLAILRDETAPPIHWRLVRIKEVHPGADGVVRVVTVRNSNGTEFRRPVVKLAPLPNPEDEDLDDQ